MYGYPGQNMPGTNNNMYGQQPNNNMYGQQQQPNNMYGQQQQYGQQQYGGNNLTYGQRIELHHIHTRSQRLHSHQINLKSGSYQQQVTCWEGHDLGDAWVIKPAHGVPLNSKQGQPVLYGDIVVLEHFNTRKNLHSHIMQSEVTKQQEVTCFGDNGVGDGNDNWRIIAEHDNQFTGTPVVFNSTIRFTHVPTNTHLHSHLANFGNHYGHTQQEVTAFAGSDGNDLWKVVPYN